MVRRAMLLPALALVSGLTASPALAQVEPVSPVHMALNGALFLCPKLVRTHAAPSAEELTKLGFFAIDPQGHGDLWFQAKGDQGVLRVSYEAEKGRCLVNYAGGGYEQIAGIVRDTVAKNGLKRITGGDRNGAKADVFEGKAPDADAHVRIIIIENYTTPSAAISYSERAGS